MPIAKVELPNGQIAKFEVPEGTTEQEVIAFANDNIDTIMSSNSGSSKNEGLAINQDSLKTDRQKEVAAELERRGMATLQPSHSPMTQDAPSHEQYRGPETTPEGIAGAITRGAGPYAIGAGAGALIGAPFGGVGAVPGAVAGTSAVGLAKLVGDPLVDMVNSQFGTRYSRPSDALEHFFTSIGVPEPDTAAERVVQQMAEGASMAGSGVATGKIMSEVAQSPVTRGVGKDLAAQAERQIVGGATGAGAGSAVQEGGGGPVEQIGAALVGGYGGARAAGTRVLPKEGAQEIADAVANNVRVMTSDIRKPENFFTRWMQATGEKIPLTGTGGPRQAQQKERVEAVRNLLEDYNANAALNSTDEVMFDLAKKRSGDITKYTKMKKNIISDVSEQGKPVNVDDTISSIDSEIQRLSRLGTDEVKPVVEKLENWKEALQGKTLAEIEDIRKIMGESFKSSDLAGSRTIGEQSVSKIYKPLRDDMGEHIQKNGKRKDYEKWDVANKRLSQMSNDLDMTAFKSTLKKGNATPEEVNKLIFSKKPSEVRKLYNALTPEGKRHARTAILSRAANKASFADGLSPEKFVNEVERLGNSVGVFFTDSDLKRVNGLVRAINTTRRAGQAAVSPPTGVQVAIPVAASVLTDLLGGFGAAVATGATVGGLARVYESAPVRNILLNISRVKPKSKEEAALVKRLITIVQQQKESENE